MNKTNKPILDADLLAAVLEDDPAQPSGGIDHIGETLGEFLDSCDFAPDEYPTTIDEINKLLINCGIKPIKTNKEDHTMSDYSYKIKQLQLMLEAEADEETGGHGAHLSHWAGKAKEINIHDDAIQALIDFYELAGGQVDHLKLHTYDLQTIVIALIYYETELEHSKYRTPDPEEMDRVKRLQNVFNGMNKMVRQDHDWTLDLTVRA